MKIAAKGETHLGYDVAGWCTLAELAEMFEITDRHIQELEHRGLPSAGRRRKKLYPFPHALVWWIAYKVRADRGLFVERLPMEVAFAESHARNVAEEAELDGTLQVQRRRNR